MKTFKRVVNGVYITGGLILVMIIVMCMSSCGSSKQFHIGTGKELGKSRCSGNYVYR